MSFRNGLRLQILGTRGIPAGHGGFETFAEKLALYLVKRGWVVTVYCQEEGNGPVHESEWEGIRLIHIPVSISGAKATILFDLITVLRSLKEPGLLLTLGYNTAIFNTIQRIARRQNIINMDGIEWHRDKWGIGAKTWFWLNERIGCVVGNHLIADHPVIKSHLATRVGDDKISTIAYGADEVLTADEMVLGNYGVKKDKYSIVIARPEPENSILEIVRAFSRKARGHKLVVLGNYQPERNKFHRRVIEAASGEVVFVGAIYEKATVSALRFFSKLYVHGHRVGGTNPSLVEGLGAGSAILAHDNPYNRWVAGTGAAFFADEEECSQNFDALLRDDVTLESMKNASRTRYREAFRWENVLGDYEEVLTRWALPGC